jgi:hypothetical protein
MTAGLEGGNKRKKDVMHTDGVILGNSPSHDTGLTTAGAEDLLSSFSLAAAGTSTVVVPMSLISVVRVKSTCHKSLPRA